MPNEFLDMSDEEFEKLGEPDFGDETPVTLDPEEEYVEAASDDSDPEPEPEQEEVGDPEPEEETADPEVVPEDADPETDTGEPEKDDTPVVDKPVVEEAQDFEALYKGLLKGFKANGREVVPKSHEDLIRLAQQGVNYHQKMAGMKPARKALKTLESNGLLDNDQLNLLIDIKNGDPKALAKFMKDQAINPMDIDTEAGSNYTPSDHSVSDTSVEIDSVLEDLQDSPTFIRTVNETTKKWDKSSQADISRDPRILAVIDEQMGNGVFDMVMDAVNYERSLGRLGGTSDFQAYKDMGNRMQAEGAFDAPVTPAVDTVVKAPVAKTPDPALEAKRLAQKKAASPTRGNKAVGSKKLPENFNPLSLSDEEFAKFDPSLLGIKL